MNTVCRLLLRSVKIFHSNNSAKPHQLIKTDENETRTIPAVRQIRSEHLEYVEASIDMQNIGRVQRRKGARSGHSENRA